MAIEIVPHNLTSDTSHSPFIVSASSAVATFEEWKAFDASADWHDEWIGNGGGVDWLEIDLGSGAARIAGSYAIQVNNFPQPLRAPKDWTFEGSNNGSSWTTLDTRTGETSWGNAEKRTYTISSPTTAYRYYRLNITANNGDATYTQVAEFFISLFIPADEFAPHNMTTDGAPSPFVASASSFATGANAYKAFDGLSGPETSFAAWIGQGGGADWLQIDLGSGNLFTVTQYQMRNVQTAARAPKDWTLKGSNNGSSWTTLDTRTNETSWGDFELRSYAVTGAAAYRYFRLNITANNGDGTYTEVDELLMQGTASAAVSIGALASRSNSIAADSILGGIHA